MHITDKCFHLTENSPVSIGYSPQKSEVILVLSNSERLYVFDIDKAGVLSSTNSIDMKNANEQSDNKDFIVDEFTMILNDIIEPVSQEFQSLKIFVRPLYDGYVVYQHGTCGHGWFIDSQYKLS